MFIIYLLYLIVTTNEIPCSLCSPYPLRQKGHQYTFYYPAAEDIKSVIGSVQCKADDAQIKSLLANLKGKSVHQLIADGQKRIGGSSAPVTDTKAAGKK